LGLEILSLVSEAALMFEGGEQLAADLASYPFGSDLLKTKFGMDVVGLQQADQSIFWLGRKGAMKIGQKQVAIDSARGNLRMLAIGVQGSTETACDALQELWTTLSVASAEIFPVGQSTVDFGRVQSLGRLFPHTTAVVKLPVDVGSLFPQLMFLQTKIRGASHASGLRASQETRLRFTCEFKFEWGGQAISTPLTIEPRANEPISDKIFFTRSPLQSDAHLKLVEEFVAHFGRRELA
jgi:hypothetical protein